MNASLSRVQPRHAALQPHTAGNLDDEPALPKDTRQPMRRGLLILGIGLGGFLLWAALAPLDEGVPTQGTVSIDTKRKPVQHLTGGLLGDILVREGEVVQAGQVVARMNAAATLANFETSRQRYLGMLASEGRLLAEQQGAASIAFDPEVLGSSEPMVQQQVATQRALFVSRRDALRAELQGIDESMRGLQAQKAGAEGQLGSQRQQLALLQEELAGVRGLVSDGYAPRSRQIELERMSAASQGQIADLGGQIERAARSILELQQRAQQRRQEFRKDVDTQLAQIRLELQADREKYRSSTDELGRTELKAPVSGQVVGLQLQSAGAVLQPGARLMDIVPLDESLVVEARIPPHLIDRVQPDLPADLRFSAFAHTPSLVVQGRLSSVSRDLITENLSTGPVSYYLARIQVTPQGMQTLGRRQMQAGMPVEAIIRTGERSLLTYLLHPLVKRMASAMKEE